MGMRKKQTILILMTAVICLVFAMTGCGSAQAVSLDESGNAPITSAWKLVQFTVNGKVTKMADEPWWVKVMLNDKNPKFSSSDGVKCVFSNNGKSHEGQMTLEDGVYNIAFGNAEASMEAVISGKTLVITSKNGTLEFVFETK